MFSKKIDDINDMGEYCNTKGNMVFTQASSTISNH